MLLLLLSLLMFVVVAVIGAVVVVFGLYLVSVKFVGFAICVLPSNG